MFRALLLFLALLILLLCVPAVRRRLVRAYGERDWRELKQSLGIALLLYFLLTVVVTLYKYTPLGSDG
jgi:uncharacterized BrkB/YihY/UPF0761 family membrane protein